MAKPKREQRTASQTSEKPRSKRSFVQVEGELTEAQLEAIAGGRGNGSYEYDDGINHNETMVSAAELNG